jgi:hypothetical protein
MSKKTLCGYAWSDVYSALGRAIGNGNMKPAQRWAAELLCSETGVSRLEAVLLAIWSEHVGSALAGWPAFWKSNILFLRDEWIKSGGDNKTFRNNTVIRNRIAECVGYLVTVSKRPRPSLPRSTDVFKEAESVKARLHGGGAAQDQQSTYRVWDSREDAPTMRTLGNEFESAIRTAQTSRALFWLVWIMTLDSQKNRPVIKDRAPTNIQGAGRKCLGWFILELLQDMATYGLDSGNCIKQIIDAIKTVWPRLGSKYRKEVMGSIVVILCERVRSGPIEIRPPHECLDTRPIRAAIEDIDTIYEELARDITANVIQESSPGSVPGTEADSDLKSFKKEQKERKDASAAHSSVKMEKAYSVLRKMYGMDDED